MMDLVINPSADTWKNLLSRPTDQKVDLEAKVSSMLRDLKGTGWSDVCRLTRQFDGYDPEPALISQQELDEASDLLPKELKNAIALAARNIQKFHEQQIRLESPVEVMEGVTCYRRSLPIERVGLYVPGGTAPLFSTVLMLAIPAALARCRTVVLCSPGNCKGIIHPAILYAANLCGVTNVFRLGGVQAVASMAYGLGPVPAVDKVFGPGNSWVTMAKTLVSRDQVAIDMPAGPSEVAVIADQWSNPTFIAADLLSQAEHGPDSQVILFTTDLQLAKTVKQETLAQLQQLPRADVARNALKYSRIVVLRDYDTLMAMVNQYAPEHLIISTKNYRDLAGMVTNAGSVFLGSLTPESAGDYASGTNHTLPTSGYARQMGGLSVEAFTRMVTFQEITAGGLEQIGPAIQVMARAEGLEGHARAVEIRMNSETSQPEGLEDSDEIADPKLKVAKRVRPNILSLVPYSSARDEYSGREGIFLDANENPNDNGLNRYPDPRQRELRQQVALRFGSEPDQVFVGNGSDEAIDLLIRIFCEPRQSRMLTLSPSYGMYAVAAQIQDVGVDAFLLNDDFTLDEDRLLAVAGQDTQIIFLCSPNNPTGNQIPLTQIENVARKFGGIVVVDEAYADFATGSSAIRLINKYPNLLILRTFSKAWGLAAARVGMAFADPFIISLLDKVKYPYNISSPAANEILQKLKQDPSTVDQSVREIIGQREWLREQLGVKPCVKTVFPSEGNFLLVKVIDARTMYQYLSDRHIIVRDRSKQPLCDNCLRITVGTAEENQRLLDALEAFSQPDSAGQHPNDTQTTEN